MNTATTTVAVDLEGFLARAIAIIKALGYVSNSEVKGTDKKSTAQLAFGWASNNKAQEIAKIGFSSADRELARQVAQWMVTIDISRLSSKDYLWNLYVIGETKVVNERSAGYAASAIGAFEKEKNKSADDKNSLAELVKTFGAVGSKLQGISAIYMGKSQFKTDYGLCYKYQFEDAAGHKIIWMTSTELTALTQGIAYRIEGTIKQYNSYNGKHECQITRAKIG